MHLTKSDFTSTRDCATKLYYKKLRYPSLNDENPYLKFLADGGYMVEKMANLLYPEGRMCESWDNPDAAFKETQDFLKEGNCTLFEATIIHGKMMARVDILQKFGQVLRVIEVKSSSVNTDADEESPFRGKKGGISADWRKYLEDITFQVIVLKRALPGYEIKPYLCVVDKARVATVNSTFDKFPLRRGEGVGARFRPEVEYTGDVDKLANEHVLAVLNVGSEVDELEEDVASRADELAMSIDGESIHKIDPVIGKKCKQCEYRTNPADGQPCGFNECWGSLAAPDPHILDLFRIDLAGGMKNDYVAELATAHQVCLGDVDEDRLTGKTSERQKLQLVCTSEGREHIDPELKRKLTGHKYPLHFIDFEASRLALPYHVGMNPYELATFQWSCHTIREPGAALEHNEWLNDDDVFPNFEFARTLRDVIGDDGTVYIWSHYEQTALKTIIDQMDACNEHDESLRKWLVPLAEKDNSRIVDLWKLAKSYYFHPVMKGSTSIKYVLPAVWESNDEVRSEEPFVKYVGRNDAGKLLNPYDTLSPLPFGDTEEDVVREGTGAMRVYQDMMFGVGGQDPAIRENYRRLLLQYCELDTAAMVIIWKHWTR